MKDLLSHSICTTTNADADREGLTLAKFEAAMAPFKAEQRRLEQEAQVAIKQMFDQDVDGPTALKWIQEYAHLLFQRKIDQLHKELFALPERTTDEPKGVDCGFIIRGPFA